MKKLFVLLVLALVALACEPTIQLTPDQQAFVYRAMQQPIPVVVAKDKAEEAWGRIQSFIAQYADMKIQIATDYVIETYNPLHHEFFYKAIKTPKGNTVEFILQCEKASIDMTSIDKTKAKCDRNVHLWALYAVTGEILPELVFKY